MPSPHPPPPPSGPAAEFFAAEVRTAAWEALVAWYREVLGLRVLLRVSDDGYALLGDARGRIAIVSRPDPGPAGERIGLEIEVAAEDVVVTETPREGWSVASGEGETVALDLELTAELRRLGAAREAVRLIQEGRKNAGLDISDRIALRWSTSSPDVAAAMREHADLIAGEVLATAYEEGPPEPDAHVGTDIDLPLEFSLRRA